MPPVVKTIREFLLGSLSDFSESTGLAHLGNAANLASLIVSLAHYQEEGRTLVPEVFLCRSVDEIAQMLPGSERIQIGTGSNAPEVIDQALKKCAPLARQGWCIYVEGDSPAFKFGLFRGSLNPTAISVERTLFSEATPHVPMIRLHRFANGCVALTNHKSESHHLMLSEKSSLQLIEPANASIKLVKAACKKVPEKHRDVVATYLEKTLRIGLADSHGTLIAVSSNERIPLFLSDGVSLVPAIDIYDSVRERHTSDADSYKLQGIASLVRGMIGTDGIVVFSQSAKVLGYNCFIRVPQQTGSNVIGGARSRAFAALRKRLGKGLVAVFAQSQDGWTKFEEEA